jgi:tetratricopeptide (TPR) repeat protein
LKDILLRLDKIAGSMLTIKLITCIVLAIGVTSCLPSYQNQLEKLKSKNLLSYSPEETKAKFLARKAYTRGSVYKMQGRFNEAIDEFETALGYDKNPEIQFALAQCYQSIVQNSVAINYAKSCLNQSPEFAPAYDLLAELYVSTNKYDSAIIALQSLNRIDSSPTNLYKLARITEMIDVDSAIAIYNRILKDDEQEVVLARLVEIYGQNRRYDDYIRTLERYLETSPDNAYTSDELLEAYLRNRNYAKHDSLLKHLANTMPSKLLMKAMVRFGAVLLDDSTEEATAFIKSYLSQIDQRFAFQPDIYEMAGYLYDRLGDSLSMVNGFNHALRLADSIPETVLRIGTHYFQTKRYELASAHFSKYIKRTPKDIRYLMLASYSSTSLQKYPDAISLMKSATRIDSTIPDAWFQLGYLYDKVSKHDSSDYCYEQALEYDPNNPLTLNNYAYSLSVRKKDLEKAKVMSEKSLQIEPRNASYLDTYGWILYNLEQYKEALPYLERAITINQTSATLFEHLGDNYSKLGMTEKSVSAWERAYELDSTKSYLKSRNKQSK